MALHLIKLCVGVDSLRELEDWLKQKRRSAKPAEHVHVTRMMPRRAEELLDGGSLYWVIKGAIQARQRLVEIRHLTDSEGLSRAGLVLEPVPVPTHWRPRRPFQGWRYLSAKDAPADLAAGDEAEMPEALRAELAALGLL
ncbi:MAG: DUF1489 domain-containing protein [Bauldia sp.]